MSLVTYDGLIAAIPGWASNSALSAHYDDFIAWAHQEINRRLRANVMLTAANLTINAETISAPTGFLAMKRLYLDVTPREQVAVTSIAEVNTLAAERRSVQYPTHVTSEGSLLHFAPVFTGSPTGKALYYKSVTVPSDDNATNVVMAAYPYLYLHGTLEALFNYQEDDNMADRHGQKFGALIEDINARDAADIVSGPSSRRVRGFN